MRDQLHMHEGQSGNVFTSCVVCQRQSQYKMSELTRVEVVIHILYSVITPWKILWHGVSVIHRHTEFVKHGFGGNKVETRGNISPFETDVI